jgi:hypothetical protein
LLNKIKNYRKENRKNEQESTNSKVGNCRYKLDNSKYKKKTGMASEM